MIQKVLPFEKLIYHSPLTKDVALERIQDQIGITKPYTGYISGDSFKIKRAISYRNSFLPEITGTIKSGISGSKIEVEMRLVQIIKVFIIVWFSGVSFAILGILYSLFSSRNKEIEPVAVFIPVAMLVFGIALVSIGFKTESKKSILDLQSTLDARIVENK